MLCTTLRPRLIAPGSEIYYAMNMEEKVVNSAMFRLLKKRDELPRHQRVVKGKRRKKKKATDYDAQVKQTRARTRTGRDEAVVRYRAASVARNRVTTRTLADAIASLTPVERDAITGNAHVISAVEKIVEAMLFRFS